MKISNGPNKSLSKFYTVTVKNFNSDFRNYNLNCLIASKVTGEIVLDIGCGNGAILNLLSISKEVIGVEPNEELIKFAKNSNSRVNIYKGLAENFNEIISQKVDTVLMIDVLEHIENDIEKIKLVYDHLNDNGELIIVVPAYLFGKRDLKYGHYRRYNKKDLCDKLVQNGFQLHAVRFWNALGFFPYLIAEKLLKRELNTELR